MWLDASQIAGLSDGDPVGTWSDLSGLGNTVSQAVEGRKPTFQTNEVNGLPVVRFDVTDDVLSNATFSEATPWTEFIVYRYSGTPGPGYLRVTVELALTYDAGNIILTDSLQNATSLDDGLFHIMVGCANGASSLIRYDQAQTAGVATNYTINPLIVGNNSAVAPIRGCSGDIAELIIYNSALAGPDITTAENYLKTKYGL